MKKTYQQPTIEPLEMKHLGDLLWGSTNEVFAKGDILFILENEPKIVDDVNILDEDDFYDEEDIETNISFNVWED